MDDCRGQLGFFPSWGEDARSTEWSSCRKCDRGHLKGAPHLDPTRDRKILGVSILRLGPMPVPELRILWRFTPTKEA